jgi:DNA-binding response OmpR family regulator
MVVDDELNIRNLAKMILEGEGYQVITASDGAEAIQKAEDEMPDLILLDVVMPEKSGLDACKFLKSNTKTKHITIVMCTVLGRDADKRLSNKVGADGHFIKPFKSEEILTVVKQHLVQARVNKFSGQLGLEYSRIKGKKILMEFDPSTPYERLVRNFVIESIYHDEKTIILTKKGSAIQQTIDGDEGIELINLTSQTMLSPIIKKYPKESISLVYDSLTDFVLLTNPKSAYGFAQDSLKLLSDPRITAIFLLNPSAHEQLVASSFRGVFSNQIVYGKDGIINIRFV